MPGSLYAPHATSLRMSDLGYRNKSQAGLNVSVNSLDHYVRDLTRAITTPHPDYEKLGVKVDGGFSNSTPTCCRSRTSTTASSARSA